MSFDKIEVRVFSGPDQVQVGSNTEPDLIVMNIGPKGDTGATGNTGATGPAGPNSVTIATTSDGTANLALNNVSTASFTAGNSSTTSGEITIFTNGPVFQWRSDTVEYGERGFTFLTTDITSEVNYTLPNASGTIALTTSNVSTATALQNSRNIFGIAFDGTANVTGDATSNGHFASIPTGGQAGHFVTLNGTAPTVVAGRSAWWSDGSGNPSFRNGTGTAVTLVKSSELGTNVANFLATPTSANLASALTDENGTGGGFVRAQGATLTGPSLVGPVNLTSQDSSTADRVMNRGLADARYQTVSEFLVTSTASVFSSLINNSISGLAGPCYTVGYSAGTTASSRSGMIISTPCVVNTNTDYSYFSGTGQGSIIDFSIPWSVFFKLIFPRSVAGDDIIRIAVGDLFAGGITVPAFGCNGFGIRLNLKSGSSTIYEVRIIGKVRQGFEANFITGATNTSPINITCANHGLANGDFIEVVNVGGNTAANGIFQISNVTSTTFDLVGSSGNGAFTSNGAFSKITQPVEIVAGQSYDIKMRNTVSGSTYGCELSINGVVVLSLSGINRFHNLFNVRSGAGIRAAISNVSNPIASFYYLLTNIRFVQPM